MSELLIRFVIGGVVVSLFAMLGDVLRPKSFAGLFGATPSIALATVGLTIHHDGTFVVGASGGVGTTQGKITPQELQRLGSLIRETSPSAAGGERTCNKGGLPGIKDQVDLTLASGAVVRIYDLGGSVGEVCYIGRWDNVHKLHQYLRALMSRYYPVPYPRH